MPFRPLCTLRNRLPALTRSDDVRVTSNTVNTPPIQVIDADGVTSRSTVLFNVSPVGPPKVGCWFADSVRRYPSRALKLDIRRPNSWRDGVIDQLSEPLGQSRVRVFNGTCASVRRVQTRPVVNR